MARPQQATPVCLQQQQWTNEHLTQQQQQWAKQPQHQWMHQQGPWANPQQQQQSVTAQTDTNRPQRSHSTPVTSTVQLVSISFMSYYKSFIYFDEHFKKWETFKMSN